MDGTGPTPSEEPGDAPAQRRSDGPRVVILTKRSVMSSGPFVRSLIEAHDVVAIFAEFRATRTAGSWFGYAANRYREHGGARLMRYAWDTFLQRHVRKECVETVVQDYPGIPYHAVSEMNEPEVVGGIASYEPDIICIGSTRLVKEPILEIPPLGCLNIHGAMLPRNAGIEPTFWALLEEEFDAIGETIHFAVPQADAGHIVIQERVPFALGETVEEIDERIIRRGAELIPQAVSAVAAGTADPRPMDLTDYSYMGRPALADRRELQAKIKHWRAEWRGGRPPLTLWTPEKTSAYHTAQHPSRGS